jgi:hypothetical protein
MTDYQFAYAAKNYAYTGVVFARDFTYRDVSSVSHLLMSETDGSSGTLYCATAKCLAGG